MKNFSGEYQITKGTVRVDEALIFHHLEKSLCLLREHFLPPLHSFGCELDIYIIFLFLIIGGVFLFPLFFDTRDNLMTSWKTDHGIDKSCGLRLKKEQGFSSGSGWPAYLSVMAQHLPPLWASVSRSVKRRAADWINFGCKILWFHPSFAMKTTRQHGSCRRWLRTLWHQVHKAETYLKFLREQSSGPWDTTAEVIKLSPLLMLPHIGGGNPSCATPPISAPSLTLSSERCSDLCG